VVAENTAIELHHLIDAFPRIRPIADDIPQAEDLIHSLRADIFQHCFERLKVAMNVAENGAFQKGLPLCSGRLGRLDALMEEVAANLNR
jgi:hypothetical protein